MNKQFVSFVTKIGHQSGQKELCEAIIRGFNACYEARVYPHFNSGDGEYFNPDDFNFDADMSPDNDYDDNDDLTIKTDDELEYEIGDIPEHVNDVRAYIIIDKNPRLRNFAESHPEFKHNEIVTAYREARRANSPETIDDDCLLTYCHNIKNPSKLGGVHANNYNRMHDRRAARSGHVDPITGEHVPGHTNLMTRKPGFQHVTPRVNKYNRAMDDMRFANRDEFTGLNFDI